MGHFKRAALAAAAALLVLLPPNPASSEDNQKDIEELKTQVEVLAEEIEKIKLGEVAQPEYESFTGLGPAASKVYSLESGLSIGGYGEFFYSNFEDSTKKDAADVQRFILYVGYKFNDWIIMNTEIEYEHADEVFVEFTYLDFLLHPSFNLRTGLMLVPVGIINEFHEPTVFNGVLRPDVETRIIPTTWRDIGIMAHGEINIISYKAAVLNGMRTDKFKKSDWIRAARFKGSKTNAENLAFVLNLGLDLFTGLKLGGSFYHGDAGEGGGGGASGPNEKEGTIDLWEVHGDYRFKGLAVRALFTRGSIDGNSALESAPPGDVGKDVQGWYLETSYDVMPLLWPEKFDMGLTPFIRYEDYDTHREVFTGTRDPSQDRTVFTLGVGFKPLPNVVIKADYQWRDTRSALPAGRGTGLDENKIDQFNLGAGFIF